MIVTCPNCETRYNLPDDKVPAGGAKVKCSKCAQVFKAEHPPAPPEEEFEALLEEETQDGEAPSGDDFDDAFDDVASSDDAGEGDESAGEEPAAEPAAEPVEESPEAPGDDFEDVAADEGVDDFSEESVEGAPEESVEGIDDDLGDLFDDEDDELSEESGEESTDDVVGDDMPDMDDLFDDSEVAPDPDEGATPSDDSDDDLFASAGDDDDEVEDLFGDDDDDDDDEGGLFDDDDEDDEIDDDDEDESPGLFADDDDLSLDDDVPEQGSRKSLIGLIVLLVVALGLGAAIYFKVWTYMGIDLADSLKDVPFVGQMFMEETGGDDTAEPGKLPADKVRKIELKNVKQYYVPNEKAGNLFVVEGKAVNKFSGPKERIKVEVILYDAGGAVLTSQSFLCGNVLSQFQLQVQTEKEIVDGLASEVGILSNNTFIRPGAATPFMAVFFQPPAGVKEFVVKVVDVGDPE